MIHRPQGRAGATKSVRVEDSDANGAAVNLTTNPKTQTRAPLPAYKTPNDALVAAIAEANKWGLIGIHDA